MIPILLSRKLSCLLAWSLASVTLSLHAGNTWDGGGADSLWGSGDNWDPNGTPPVGSTVDLFFSGTTRLISSNNYTAFDDFRNIDFTSGAGAFVVSGNAIDIFGRVENQSTNLQTLSLTLAVNAGQPKTGEFNPVSGDLLINGAQLFNNGNTLQVWGNNQKTLTFDTVISGAGGLSLNENNTVVLGRTNLYTGDTLVNAGKLVLNANQNGSILRVGALTGTNAAAVLVNAGVTSLNTIVIRPGSSGPLTIGATNTAGAATYAGSLFLDTNVTLTSASGGTVIYTNGVIDLKHNTAQIVGAGTTLMASRITNTTGSGTLFLSGGTVSFASAGITNSHTGGTIIGTNTIVRIASASAATNNVGSVAYGVFGRGNLTLSNGVSLIPISGGTVGLMHQQVNLNGDVTLTNGSNAGRLTLSSQVIDLGGGSRTLTLSKVSNLTNWGGGGTEAVQFQQLLGANVIRVQNGTLGFVSTATGSGYSAVRWNNAMNFTNNAGLTLGDHVTTVFTTSTPFGSASNAPAVTVNSGGVLNLSDMNTNRTINIASLAGAGTVASLATNSGLGRAILNLGSGITNAIVTDFSGSIRDSEASVVPLGTNNVVTVIKGGGTTQILSGSNTYSGATIISGGTLQVGNGGASGNLGSGAITNNATLAYNRSDTVTLSAPIVGSGAFAQLGSGTVILTLTNISSGPTLIQNGTLQVGNGGTDGVLGTAVVTNNGTLAFNRSGTFTNTSGIISGTGRVSLASGGALQLNNANLYTGGTVSTNGGTLLANNNSALGLGAITLGGGAGLASVGAARTLTNALILAGDVTLGGYGFDINLNGGGDLGSATRTLTLSNNVSFATLPISGTGGLTVLSDGSPRTVSISITNLFSGGLTIGSNVVVRSTVNGALAVSPGITNISANPLGIGSLTFQNGSTLASSSGSTLYQSGVNILGDVGIGISNQLGRIILSAPVNLGGGDRTLTLARSATLASLASGLEAIRIDAPATGGNGKITNGNLIVTTTNTGGNYSIFRINNTVDFTGHAGLTIGDHVITTFGGGTPFGAGNNAPTVTVAAGGILNVSDGSGVSRSLNIHSLSGDGSVANYATAAGTGTVTLGAGTADFSGVISDGPNAGFIALVKNGAGSTQTLSGVNTYSGATTISNGTLKVTGSIANSAVTVASNGVLSGTGIVGDTYVDDGGHLAPGASPGVLTVTNGNLSLAPTANLDFEIGAITNARSYYDVVQVFGDLNLDGKLNITSWTNGFGATSGTNVYALFDYTGTLTDTGVELGAVPTNLAYLVDTAVAGQVNLSVKEFAQGSFTNDSLSTTLTLNFGSQAQSFSSNALAFQIFNFDPLDLALGLELTNLVANFGPFSFAGSTFTNLTTGGQLFTTFMDLSSVGVYSNQFVFDLGSTANGYLFAGNPNHLLTVILQGEVTVIPEPGSLVALLVAAGTLVSRRRRA